MKNLFRLLSIKLIGLTLIGCGTTVTQEWTTRKQYEQVVWADDGSDVAIVELQFEEKTEGFLSSTKERRNFNHRVLVQDIQSSEQHSITEWRDHQSGQIFYMKKAGYLVVESLLDEGIRRFDKIDLEGREILILETSDQRPQGCQSAEPIINHSVIPSPDGGQLANVYSAECGKITVEFLYANSLTLIDSQTLSATEPLAVLWHPQGYLILTNHTLTKAWKVAVQESITPATPPNCFFPKTTSSRMSLNGQLVYFEEDKLLTKNVGRQEAFGCQ